MNSAFVGTILEFDPSPMVMRRSDNDISRPFSMHPEEWFFVKNQEK